MDLGKAIRDYVAESVKRQGRGYSGSGFRDSIDRLVKYFFDTLSKPVKIENPRTLNDYIKQQVCNALSAKQEKIIEISTAVAVTGEILVTSVNPPLGKIGSRTVAFAHIKPVKVGATYPYSTANNIVLVQGDSDGSIGKAQRYSLADQECNFYFHPRDTTAPAGRKFNGEPIAFNGFIYPLVDDDQGTRGLDYGTKWQLDGNPPENYGNIDWMGESESGQVITFRGPATRLMQMVDTDSYPGFTAFDYEDFYGVSHYTPFSNFVYQEGEVLKKFTDGYKVVGASLYKGSLIVMLNIDYSNAPNPDGGVGGFFNEVWYGGVRIGFNRGSRPRVPWLFNSSGTEAIHNLENLKVEIIDGDPPTTTFTDLPPAGTGTMSTTIADKSWSIKTNGNWTMYKDYLALQLLDIAFKLTDSEESGKDLVVTPTTQDLQVKVSGPAHDEVLIIGPNTYTVPSAYTYSLTGGAGNCPVVSEVWSYPTGCGVKNITVTLTLQGGAVMVGSRAVTMPLGSWVYSHTVGTCYSACNDYGMPGVAEFYDGNTKYVASIYWGLIDANGTLSSGTGVPVGGTSGGFMVHDNKHILSLPAYSDPATATSYCTGGCGGWYHGQPLGGGCGVCGACHGSKVAKKYYYAACYHVYNFVCP